MRSETLAVLKANLEGLRKSIQWLRRSYERCLSIGVRENYAEDEFDAFENLAGRFARATDLIVNKVFRSIDAMELEEAGTVIDIVNRAEKRALVDSAQRIRELKDLRNDIGHEYETDDLRSLFRQVLEAAPELFGIAERTERYCQRFEPSGR